MSNKAAVEIPKSYDENFVKETLSSIVDKDGILSKQEIQHLEHASYLESYLWAHFVEGCVREHIFSIVVMVNEKLHQGLLVFDVLTSDKAKFTLLFKKVIEVGMDFNTLSYGLRFHYISFFINCFQSLENSTIRECALSYVSLSLWKSLSPRRLSLELDMNENIQQHWEELIVSEQKLATDSLEVDEGTPAKKKRKSTTPAKGKKATKAVAVEVEAVPQKPMPEVWFPFLLNVFLTDVSETTDSEDASLFHYLEKFSELLIDLLSQLPTRRFLNTLLDDLHFVIRCKQSTLLAMSQSKLFSKLLGIIELYVHFEIDDITGMALSVQDVSARHNEKLLAFQQIAFSTEYNEILSDVYFCSLGQLGNPVILKKHFSLLTTEQLIDIADKMGHFCERDIDLLKKLGWVSGSDEASVSPGEWDSGAVARQFVIDILLDLLAVRESQLEALNRLSLYPTEELLWDFDQVPVSELVSKKSGNNTEKVLALPKLNLQFLTMYDYLLRNFNLFRLESAFEIREDLTDVIRRMGPVRGPGGRTAFSGWARMALAITSFRIDEVSKPHLGEIIPGQVTCCAEIDLSKLSNDVRQEWEDLKLHDVVFFACIENPSAVPSKKVSTDKEKVDVEEEEEQCRFQKQFGVQYIRGGEIFEVRDEDNVIINDPTKPEDRNRRPIGNKRVLRIRLDSTQYFADMKDGRDCYDRFNLIVRRKAKENNFKPVLETIRDLLNSPQTMRGLPTWLHDTFLGYGNSSVYFTMPGGTSWLSADGAELEHHPMSVPKATVTPQKGTKSKAKAATPKAVTAVAGATSTSRPLPPYTLQMYKKKDGGTEVVVATSYSTQDAGPYPEDIPPRNTVAFTPVQTKAIRSGMNEGLTMVVGPPGTGKTDTAVQIICNLYHNNPTQKILIITHSNAALNDLFEKIMQRNVEARHLLRLGSGESELRETLAIAGAGGEGRGQGEEFNKSGRVNWCLNRRLQLLDSVKRLALSLQVAGDVGYTCETAEYFYLADIKSRLEKFKIGLANAKTKKDVDTHTVIAELFPFANFFADAALPLFCGDLAKDEEKANSCFRHVDKIFDELADYRAFELLRTQGHRSDYLLTKQARIVAMTCTHAAMTRRRLVGLDFKYDSVIMEESAQVLEVETLIPLLVQNFNPVDGCRLKRFVLLGDHHQLPPVVKHVAFQKFSKLDQSLFSRFVRLGVPSVMLDKQGRARAEIAALYSWRYANTSDTNTSLGNLPIVSAANSAYSLSNPGLLHTFQLIDVPDFKGKGETSPTPHFYQNLGEAEYVVAMYQYMRLLGYPADKISILTTYNGQRQLIVDIVRQRCSNSIFGQPASVTTVDKYQGQQNDYVLLSLVRTASVGHVRDVRRLVVAMSRARLGLYVFCRTSLFSKCFELKPVFSQLLTRSTKLQLVVGETYQTVARETSSEKAGAVLANGLAVHEIGDVSVMGVLVYQMVQQAQAFSTATPTTLSN